MLLVKAKLEVGVAVPILATTLYEPPVALAVNVGAVATPLLLVEATAVVDGPGKVPLAPLAGAVKVT